MKSIRDYTHSDIFYCGLVIMAIGLPLSKFLMSISQMILVANWLIQGGISNKLKLLFKNKAAIVVCSFYLVYVVGLLHSSNWEYALNELRIKLPLFIIPFILATSPPLSLHLFYRLMNFFVGAVLLGTLASMGELLGVNDLFRHLLGIPTSSLLDIREISLFISHIRFSLMICLATFYLFYIIIWKSPVSRLYLLCCWLLIVWFLSFLFLIESVTGFAITFSIGLVLIGYLACAKNKRWVQIFIACWVVIIPIGVLGYLYSMYNEFTDVTPVDVNQLEKLTAQGNPYIHDIHNTQVENGNYIWMYMCKKELQEEWSKRSQYDYHGLDKRNQELEYTLIRFLASKGLRKDAEGIKQLTNEEIHVIENGIANLNNMHNSLHSRIYNIIWEIDDYLRGGNPGGHSVTQRFEYWKTAGLVIMNNLWVGTGTGDLMDEMNIEYKSQATSLEQQYWKRPHNQFLSIAGALGIMGLMGFVFSILYPLFVLPEKRDILYAIFLLIVLGSMVSEDTLDTQAGVTFFAFFNALFLFSRLNRN